MRVFCFSVVDDDVDFGFLRDNFLSGQKGMGFGDAWTTFIFRFLLALGLALFFFWLKPTQALHI